MRFCPETAIRGPRSFISAIAVVTCFFAGSLGVAAATSTPAAPPDLTGDGPTCQAISPLARAQRQQVSTRRDLPSPAAAPVQELWGLSHQLNADYIKNLTQGLPTRLQLAQNLAIDPAAWSELARQTEQSCTGQDPLGKSLQPEYLKFRQALQARSPALTKRQIDKYVVTAVIALLEYRRLQSVFYEGIRQFTAAAGNSAQQQQIGKASSEALLRLLILRERFPLLQNTGWGKSSANSLVSYTHMALMNMYEPLARGQAFYGDPSLDRILGYTAIPHKPGDLTGEQLIESLYVGGPVIDPTSRVYPHLYLLLRSRRQMLPEFAKQAVLDAVRMSVTQSLTSVKMKCESTPCSTFRLQPELVAKTIEARADHQSLEPWVCACGLDHQQGTISTQTNLAIAAAGSGLTLLCVTNPEISLVCTAALISSLVDVGAGIAGIYDGEVNTIATESTALARSGDVVPPIEEYRTQVASQRDHFNNYYNWITGLLSFLPYRVPRHQAYQLYQIPFAILNDRAVQECSAIETVKAASALPPPQLMSLDPAQVDQVSSP